MEKIENNKETISNIDKKQLEKEFKELISEKDKFDIDGLDFNYCGTSNNQEDFIKSITNNWKNNTKANDASNIDITSNCNCDCSTKKENTNCCENNTKEANPKSTKKAKNKVKKESKNIHNNIDENKSSTNTINTNITNLSKFSKKFISKDICQKCAINKSKYYVRQEYFCGDCFIKSNEHKFRSNLRAHCRIRHEDNLLVCLSGGINSMLMLHLFNLSLNESTSTKKLFFKIKFLFVDDSFFYSDYRTNKDKDKLLILRKENVILLEKLASLYQFEITTINLEYCLNLGLIDSLNENKENSTNLNEKTDFELIDKLISNIDSLNNVNYRNRYCSILTKNLIYYYSIINKFDKIVLGNSQTTLMNDVFNNLIDGRGNNICVSYVDSSTLPGKLTLLYPMKDFLEKEVLIMLRIWKINTLKSSVKNLNNKQENIGGKSSGKPLGGDHSLLISLFLSKLQDKAFPTTPTVISTAEKLIVESFNENNKNNDDCNHCEMCFGRKDGLYNEMEIGSIEALKDDNR